MITYLDGVRETVDYEENALVRLYNNVETEGYPLHWHPAVEIIIPLIGDYQLTIQNHEIHLDPGEILWISPGVLHTIAEPEAGGQRLILLFEPTIMQQFEDLSILMPFLAPYKKISQENFATVHQQLQDILRNILSIEYESSPLKNVEIYTELIRFTAKLGNVVLERFKQQNELHNSADTQEESLTQANVGVIYECCQYIRTNSRKDLTLDHLAQKAGFSKFYFSRLFKDLAGMSFIDYLKSCRIRDVELLLADPEISITDAAITAGFNSLSTFNRVFKEMKKITPLEFRKLNHVQYSGQM